MFQGRKERKEEAFSKERVGHCEGERRKYGSRKGRKDCCKGGKEETELLLERLKCAIF